MRRLVLVVAVAVLLGGCNAFGTGDAPGGPSVTPVDVPTAAGPQSASPTGTEGTCLVPRPATPSDRPAETPAEPVALPRDGGVVNGSALVDRHASRLVEHRYHLHVRPNADAWVVPDVAAFTYEGLGLGLPTPWAYAVAGRLYTLYNDRGGLVLEERPYRLESPVHRRYASVLTGRRWLDRRVGLFNYTVVETRVWNGTAVRVLRDTREQPLILHPSAEASGIVRVNSTVYVDRRGIVRYVRHVREIEYGPSSAIPNETEVGRLMVDELGTARLHRPAGFCVVDPASVRTPTPTADDVVVESPTPTADAVGVGSPTATPLPLPETATANGTSLPAGTATANETALSNGTTRSNGTT